MRRPSVTPVAATAALVVAVLGATPLGQAAGERVAAAVPFAKSAGYARLADNATKLNGRRSTLAGAPGTIPVVGGNGKLPVSVGAVGPQGPRGEAGQAGPRGISGYEIVTASEEWTTPFVFTTATARCPGGKKVLGGAASVRSDTGAVTSGYRVLQQHPVGDSMFRAVFEIRLPLPETFVTTVYAICADVS